MNKSEPSQINTTKKRILEGICHHLQQQFNLQKEQVEGMLPTFIETLATHMQNLEQALITKNLNSLGKASHTIKGAFLNLGMKECAEVALIIEEKCREGDSVTDFSALIKKLKTMTRPVFE